MSALAPLLTGVHVPSATTSGRISAHHKPESTPSVATFERIVDDYQSQLQGRPDDVVINLVEVVKENWSFGHGVAQYAS